MCNRRAFPSRPRTCSAASAKIIVAVIPAMVGSRGATKKGPALFPFCLQGLGSCAECSSTLQDYKVALSPAPFCSAALRVRTNLIARDTQSPLGGAARAR